MKISFDFLNGFQSDGQMILAIVIVIAASILILLLLREVFCWYYKINSRLREARKTNALLEEIRDELAALNNAAAAISYQNQQMQYNAGAAGYPQDPGYGYGQYGADPYQQQYAQAPAQPQAQQYAQAPSQPQAQQYAQAPQPAQPESAAPSGKSPNSYSERQKRYAQEQKAKAKEKEKAAVNPHAAPEPPYVAAHMQYPSSADAVTVAFPMDEQGVDQK